MRWFRLMMPLLALVGCALATSVATAADGSGASAWTGLDEGAIVLLRHAEAPGIGDPAGFQLGDCRTQRNLNDAGRAQARRIGEAFRHQAVKVGAVWASQWCRTHETAELAFPGQVRDDARFNSFFDASDARAAAQTKLAESALRAWAGPGVLVVVTHQVNITALTGVVPAPGEAVIVRAHRGALKTVGRLAL